MAIAENPRRSWSESLRAIATPRAITMLFMGFSAGLPLLLIFSSLGLWLREAGLDRSSVTLFSWAALGYSFKFVWAPLVDRLPLPVLTPWLGRRRAWILMAQIFIIIAILWMGSTDPSQGGASLTMMAMAAVMLGFSSATQDIVIDAYRIELADADMQAMLSATYIAGYRIGMLVSGAGALYLAGLWGSTADGYLYGAWRDAYYAMAGAMLIAVVVTLLAPEPQTLREDKREYATSDYARFVMLFVLVAGVFIMGFTLFSGVAGDLRATLSESFGNKALGGFFAELVRLSGALAMAAAAGWAGVVVGLVDRRMAVEAYVDPVRAFFQRYGWRTALLLLALVGLYRISDIVLGVIANVFYQDMGFTKAQIAGTVKTFGLFMTIAGGFVGGVLAVRYGVMRVLFAGALLSLLTNLLFILLAQTGNSMPMLYLVISADNLTAGLASAAFVAFLSSLTDVRFTAIQYAIFSSLMTLLPKVIGGYSGAMVDGMGYETFFLITACLGVPVLGLVWSASRRFDLKNPAEAK